MKDTSVSMRLSAKGKEELLRTFREMGGEWEKQAKRIERDGKTAGAGLQAVNKAAEETKKGLSNLAGHGGILGDVLSAMGPGGLAAAAGVGAVTVALGSSLKVAREAVKAFDEIGKSAASLELSTDAFQGLTALAADEGVEFARVEGVIRSLDKAHADLVRGTGELYTRLKDTNPQLVEMLRNTTSNDERLRILADALRTARNETERAHIAYAAFGESGSDVARILAKQEGGLDGVIDRARELGLVVREDVIRNAEEMQGKLDTASRIVDLQLKQAFIDLAPVLLDSAKLMADLSTGLADFVAEFRSFESLSDRQFNNKLQKAGELVSKLGASQEAINKAITSGSRLDTSGINDADAYWGRDEIEKFNALAREAYLRGERETRREVGEYRRRATKEDLEAELAAQEDLLQQLEQNTKEANANPDTKLTFFDLSETQRQADEARRQIAQISAELARREGTKLSGVETAEQAAERKRREAERQKLEQDAIRLRKELGDYTAYLAEQSARYHLMLDAGLITQSQYDAAVKALKDDLSGVAEVTKTWSDLVEQSRGPVGSVTEQIKKLNKDYAEGRVEISLYAAALDALMKDLAEAKETERTKLPGFSDAEKVRDELKQAAADAMSPAEKLKAEQERINALVKEGSLQGDDATEWLALYEKRLREAANANGLLAQSEELIDGIQSGRIKTLGDLGRAFSAMLVDMVRDYLAANAKMKGNGGSFLDYIFGTGNFGFGGSGTGGTGTGGGGFWSSAASAIASFFAGSAGQSHSGGSGRKPATYRNLSRGLYPGESLQAVEDSETILTESGRMNIAGNIAAMASERLQMAGLVNRALSGVGGAGAQGAAKVTINNYTGAEVSSEQRNGPDGPEVSIDIKTALKDYARSGLFDGPFAQRYGLKAVGE